ncbi:MAG: DUF4136 domain-containing protein [Gammaproteobacteria bacterium]|nr:DUF4136 domain-containing protein [Gammaproteobacteria bacterium]NIO61596.1 DUF4136 domain-containing protein [Gammaproteobacteria bacterium]NIP49904.1 DUF4136 domain-containing protein [Gammaproteobacteria bacterium]NIQ18847.1 DUF4136 domain-containing protein [Gammaproteobacteria bacterium]NIR95794.1 DUF4136 domain-containing protein [Gammaproteobacteria bacterium]
MNKRILSAIILAVFIAGCSTFPKDDIQIQSEADPKVNFSGYKTYAWLGAVGIVKDPQGQWEPPQFDADSEITLQINNALRSRGMREDDANPDMLVAYALGIDMEALQAKQDPETDFETLENVPQAGLIVLLIDPETEFVTWVSIAIAEYKNLEPEVAKLRIKYAINEMFKGLPR